MKLCRGCSTSRPLEDFFRDSTKKDGRANRCRLCRGCKPRDPQPDGYKRCAKCKISKPFADFSRGNRTKNGLQSWCKACTAECSNAHYHRNTTPERRRENHLKYHYHLSPEAYKAMGDSQGWKCAICGDPFTESAGIDIDHDHATGRVRALLCSNCNKGLGLFRDDPERLASAVRYLSAPTATPIFMEQP